MLPSEILKKLKNLERFDIRISPEKTDVVCDLASYGAIILWVDIEELIKEIESKND